MDTIPLIQPHPPSSSSNFSLLLNLYIGHFLARWGARMWEFSVGLYMIHISPDSLLLAAIYGVVDSASTAFFGPLIGQWVDKLSYLQVLRLWLFTQNLSFVVAGGAVVAVLLYGDYLFSSNHVAFFFLVMLINISGATAVLSTLAGTILIEREWVVIISEDQPPGSLTKMNSVIRRIDLTCKLFAPVASGFIISFVSLTASAMTLVLWNILSVCVQYWLLMLVYNGFPILKEVSQRRAEKTSAESSIAPCTNEAIPDERSIVKKFIDLPYIRTWRLYLKQDVVLPGLALALLFFTVLSFGSLMTATLEWQGIPAYVIGTGRGISAIIGIGATFVYPVVEIRIATLRTGLWSIWSQWSCLLLCVGSIVVTNKVIAAYMLMSGVAFSRLGLWMFDLSVIQLMQDNVSESDRCIIGGVQNSVQSYLDLMTYVVGIIVSNPKDFWKLAVISFVVVTNAGVLYTVHVYRVRKHLLHYDKICGCWEGVL